MHGSKMRLDSRTLRCPLGDHRLVKRAVTLSSRNRVWSDIPLLKLVEVAVGPCLPQACTCLIGKLRYCPERELPDKRFVGQQQLLGQGLGYLLPHTLDRSLCLVECWGDPVAS